MSTTSFTITSDELKNSPVYNAVSHIVSFVSDKVVLYPTVRISNDSEFINWAQAVGVESRAKRPLPPFKIEITGTSNTNEAMPSVMNILTTELRSKSASTEMKSGIRRIAGVLARRPESKSLVDGVINNVNPINSGGVKITEIQVASIAETMRKNPLLLSYVVLNYKRGEMFSIYSAETEKQLIKMQMKIQMLDSDINAGKDVSIKMGLKMKMERKMGFLKGAGMTLYTKEVEMGGLWPAGVPKTFANARLALEDLGNGTVMKALTSEESEMWKTTARLCFSSSLAVSYFLESKTFTNWADIKGWLAPDSDVGRFYKTFPEAKRNLLINFIKVVDKDVQALKSRYTAGNVLESQKYWWAVCSIWNDQRNIELKASNKASVPKPVNRPFNEIANEMERLGMAFR